MSRSRRRKAVPLKPAPLADRGDRAKPSLISRGQC